MGPRRKTRAVDSAMKVGYQRERERESEVGDDHGDKENTLQDKRTPRYAYRKEPLL